MIEKLEYPSEDWDISLLVPMFEKLNETIAVVNELVEVVNLHIKQDKNI